MRSQRARGRSGRPRGRPRGSGRSPTPDYEADYQPTQESASSPIATSSMGDESNGERSDSHLDDYGLGTQDIVSHGQSLLRGQASGYGRPKRPNESPTRSPTRQAKLRRSNVDKNPRSRSGIGFVDDSEGAHDETSSPQPRSSIPGSPLAIEPETGTGSDDESDDESGAIPGQEFVEMGAQLSDRGIYPLIEAAYNADKAEKHPLIMDLRDDRTAWNDKCGITLCSMDLDVITQITSGNLAQAYYAASQGAPRYAVMQNWLDSFRKRGSIQPSIYVRILADEQGRSPTMTQIKVMAQHLDHYIKQDREHSGMAFRIDSAFNKGWTQGMSNANRRFYMETPSTNNNISPSRRRRLRRFQKMLYRRVGALNLSDLSEMLTPPLQYFGYTKNAEVRTASHEEHSATNYIMTWVEAYFHAVTDGNFKMRTFTICIVAEEDQAAYAEMLLARIGNGYHETGRGFNIQKGGLTATSIRMAPNFTARVKEMIFDEYYRWAMANTPLNQNLQLQKPLVDSVKRERDEQRLRDLENELASLSTSILATSSSHINTIDRAESWRDRIQKVDPDLYSRARQDQQDWRELEQKARDLSRKS